MTTKILIRDSDYRGGNLYATLDQIQAVWGFVSVEPLATLSCMASHLGISRSKVFHIVHFLEEAGYIRCVGRSGKTVLIPFVEGKRVALVICVKRDAPPEETSHGNSRQGVL